MFLMFGLGSKKPWESLVFRFWGFGGGVWRLCSLPVDWSRYWHPGRERPCARELGFDRPEPVAKASFPWVPCSSRSVGRFCPC